MFNEVIVSLLTGMVGASVPTLLGVLFYNRQKRLDEASATRTDERRRIRAWHKAAVTEFYGPLTVLLRRTNRGVLRWTAPNRVLETQVMKDSHERIRALLLTHFEYVPDGLVLHADHLLEHIDVWLEMYERKREHAATEQDDFVFAGPEGFPFPKEAEAAFMKEYDRLRGELYEGSALVKA